MGKENLACIAPAEYVTLEPCSGAVLPRELTDGTTVPLCEAHASVFPVKGSSEPKEPPSDK